MANKDRLGEEHEIKCLKCNQWTTHTIRGVFNRHKRTYDGDYWETVDHDLLECDGCHTGVYRTTLTTSEMTEPDLEAVRQYYPPRPSLTTDWTPKEFEHFGAKHRLWPAYLQTIAATNGELPTMIAAGLRLLVEGVCKELMPDPPSKPGENKWGPNLKVRINNLLTEGFVSLKQSETLHHIRDIGNDSVHEAGVPEIEELRCALAVVEHLLVQAFDQPLHIQVISSARAAVSKQRLAVANPGSASPLPPAPATP